MTQIEIIRQSEISSEVLKYCHYFKESKLTAESVACIAFEDGAKWADNNPKEKSRKVLPIIKNTLIVLAFIALFFAILYLIASFAYLSLNFLTWDVAIRAAIGFVSIIGGSMTGIFVIVETSDIFQGKGMRCPAG